MTITFSTGPYRRKPHQGDRHFFKTKGGWHIRRQVIVRYPNGQVEGYQVRNGRPVWEWVREADLEKKELDSLRSVGIWHGGLNPFKG